MTRTAGTPSGTTACSTSSSSTKKSSVQSSCVCDVFPLTDQFVSVSFDGPSNAVSGAFPMTSLPEVPGACLVAYVEDLRTEQEEVDILPVLSCWATTEEMRNPNILVTFLHVFKGGSRYFQIAVGSCLLDGDTVQNGIGCSTSPT